MSRLRSPKFQEAQVVKQTKVAADAISALEKHAAEVRAILRQPITLHWSTTVQCAYSLRWILCFLARWIVVRKQFAETMREAWSLQYQLSHSFIMHSCLQRETGGGWSRCYSESERTQCPDDFRAAISTLPTVTLAISELNRWNALADQFKTDYEQFHALLDALPDYLSIKRVMPLHGRAAYSLILAADTGKGSPHLAREHKLFGWHYSNLSWAESLHAVARAIVPTMRERGGPAPSVKVGRQLLNDARHNPRYAGRPAGCDVHHSHTMPAAKHIRLEQFIRRNETRIGEVVLGGNFANDLLTPSFTPSFIKYALDLATARKAKIRAALVCKIAGESWCNRVPTIVTGEIERVSGDDYAAPALYIENGRTTSGYILLRAGWPDCIHCLAANCLAPDGTPNAQAISEALESGSRYHFQWKREEALRRLTQNQRIAKLLRALRSIPKLTLSDSYAAGNCVPGTEQFCRQLGIAPDSSAAVTGRELAVLWRNRSYPQQERFANVILRLASSAAAAEQAGE